jgi:SNF2 family DNA or RNA helicase
MAEKEKMIIDLCFSSDDEKEKEKDTGPIDLCSPDASEDEGEPSREAEPARAAEPAGVEAESVKREAPPGAAPPAKRARVDGEGGDDDVEEVAPPPPARPPQAPSAGATNDDDEIQITQHSGALTDFPHSREHCTTFPIAADASKRCANCYCYVCDAPAAKCTQWATHCNAKHSDPSWRAARAAHARGESDEAAQQLAARGTATAPALVALVTPSGKGLDGVLEAVTRVYPEEAQTPAGFATGITLRPYQRQSLAFMLNVERRTGNELPPLGEHGATGGWLCDEVGMGKTAVCVALCLAHPSTKKRGSDAAWYGVQRALTCKPQPSRWLGRRFNRVLNPLFDTWQAPPQPRERVNLKTTLVLTNVSLVGQWEDEVKKFAPGLRVQRFYGSNKFSARAIGDWRDVDVLISTFTTSFAVDSRFGRAILNGVMFHRVIVDECHLARWKSDISDLRAAHKWAVTGTPFQGSARDLITQAYIIGQDAWGAASQPIHDVTTKYQSEKGSKGATRALVAALRPRMIRHTKAQRIGGAVALALPDEVVSTVTLEQSAAEQAEYKAVLSRGAYRVSSVRGGGKPCFAVAMAISAHRQACQRSRVKRHALFADLQNRAAGSGCRAVIFTEYREVHADIVSQLRMRFPGFEVFEFSGGTSAAKRHAAIRSFQANDGRNKVFVITMRAGNVGITLTAADVVYLLGPCVDPSDEVQAAGRIHRLGQTRQVLLKKFVMKGTVEESIVEMHAKLKDGTMSLNKDSVSAAVARLLCSK